jgi:F-type H+-transporting ATPase subunit delta
MKDIVVDKYAKAFFEVTYEKGLAGECAQQFAEITKAFSQDVVAFFKNPFNSLDNKLSVAKSAIEGKCSPETFNFICALVEKNRVGAMHEISKELTTLVQASAGITKGKLYSAVEVSPEFLKQVEASASGALGKKVELAFEKDASLIAGYKVQVGGWTLDDSAEAHLRILKDELMKKGL